MHCQGLEENHNILQQSFWLVYMLFNNSVSTIKIIYVWIRWEYNYTLWTGKALGKKRLWLISRQHSIKLLKELKRTIKISIMRAVAPAKTETQYLSLLWQCLHTLQGGTTYHGFTTTIPKRKETICTSWYAALLVREVRGSQLWIIKWWHVDGSSVHLHVS